MPLSSIEVSQLSSFFTTGKRATTKALESTRSNHCTGEIESSKEVTKSLLFLLSNRLADLLGLKLLNYKMVNLVTNILGSLRAMLSVNGRSHMIHHMLILRIFATPKKLCFWQIPEKVLNQLNSAN